MSLRRWTHRAIECSEVDTSIRMDTSWSSRDTGMLGSLPIVPVPIGNQWASSAERVVPPSLSPPPAHKNAHCKTAQQQRVYSGVAGTVQRYDAYSLAGGSVEAEMQSRGPGMAAATVQRRSQMSAVPLAIPNSFSYHRL